MFGEEQQLAQLRAVIWDVDGTIAETERDGHRVAFNRAFEALGVAWRWDEGLYGRLLEVSGGYERLLHDMAQRPLAPSSPAAREALARRVHARKNIEYVELVAAGGIGLREGVRRLMDECRAAGVLVAIATTTGRANVESLFAREFGGNWELGFAAVLCAEDAPVKKPDPSIYIEALRRLGISAAEAVAIEDSPNGLKAAHQAGIRTLVTPSAYFLGEAFPEAALQVPGLDARVRVGASEFERCDLALLRTLVQP